MRSRTGRRTGPYSHLRGRRLPGPLETDDHQNDTSRPMETETRRGRDPGCQRRQRRVRAGLTPWASRPSLRPDPGAGGRDSPLSAPLAAGPALGPAGGGTGRGRAGLPSLLHPSVGTGAALPDSVRGGNGGVSGPRLSSVGPGPGRLDSALGTGSRSGRSGWVGSPRSKGRRGLSRGPWSLGRETNQHNRDP